MICEDFNLAFFIGNFGGFEADVSDFAFEAVSLEDDGVANAELIFCDDGDAGDEVFNHILEGKANDCGQNPETGEQRSDVDAENG